MSALPKPPIDGEALAALKAEERARGRGLRLGDGLDALLVREVQQALSGRVFPAILIASLVAMLGLVIAVIGDTHGMLSRGNDAFTGVLMVLSFLVLVIVPLQAFIATRQESSGESAEALLLTRLSPWAIVRGKLTAANVHMLLWVSLAAPLLALTWLLRGVSVPQILLGLLLAMLGSMMISSLAVALGTLARFERVSSLINLLGLVGILGAATGWMTFMGYSVTGSTVRIHGEGVAVLMGIGLPTMAFAILVARSQFTHAFENRSTHFRVLLPAVIILAFVAMAPFVTDDDAYMFPLMTAATVFGAFVIFAATEEDALSPWLALRVPKSPLRGKLVALLLPGGARGLLWGLAMFVLLAACIPVAGALSSTNFHVFSRMPSGAYTSHLGRQVILIALYAMFYGSLGALVRPKLRPGVAGNWIARSFVVFALIVFSVLPALLQFLLTGLQKWTILQVFNPFWSVTEADRSPLLESSAFLLIAFLTGLQLLAMRSRLRRALSDVVAAGAARRMREG